MTWICAKSPQPPSVSVKNHWGETNAALVTSVGRVVERPFERFVVYHVLSRGRRRPGLRAAGRRQGMTAKSHESRAMSFPWGISSSANRHFSGTCWLPSSSTIATMRPSLSSVLPCHTTLFRIELKIHMSRLNPTVCPVFLRIQRQAAFTNSLLYVVPCFLKNGVPWNRCHSQAECQTIQLSNTGFCAAAILDFSCHSALSAPPMYPHCLHDCFFGVSRT